MLPALEQFNANFIHVRGIVGVGDALAALAPHLIVDETYRAGIAMSVSALDHYVHERALQGMLEVYRGLRPATRAYNRFQLRIQAVHLGLASPAGAENWFEAEVRFVCSFKTFQKADDIADAVRAFSGVELWPAVGAALGQSAQDVKDRLNLIVDRRNKIVHEFDNEPTGLGARWPVTSAMATNTANFIEDVVLAIEAVA